MLRRVAVSSWNISEKVLQSGIKQRIATLPVAMNFTRAMSSPAEYKFETLNVTRPREFVVQVELNRPEKRNAMNMVFWGELRDCFIRLAEDKDCRAVVVSGAGKVFTAGIDLMDLSQIMEEMETGQKALLIRRFVFKLQESFNAIEKCPKPVIAAVHSACIGGGVDMVTACDIRYCSQDAFFQVKEVDVGLAADLGTLQRLPKIIGNQSLVRELAFTARKLEADEAKQCGLVSCVQPDREATIAAALEVAADIAEKSPVAVQGTKVNLIYSRDHSVEDGLNYVATWNQSLVQSEDVGIAIMAGMQKEKPVFSKL